MSSNGGDLRGGGKFFGEVASDGAVFRAERWVFEAVTRESVTYSELVNVVELSVFNELLNFESC